MSGFRAFVLALGCFIGGAKEIGHAAATFQIGQNFTGSTFGPDSEASPADANGAIGPQHFVELINGRFSVYDKTTGDRVQTMTDLQFWRAAGITLSSSKDVSDPRVVFDTYSQRWFASMIDISATSSRQPSNHFLLAVSQTSDPTGAWSAVSIAADPNNVNFADFPTLGLDQTGVYLSGDLFNRASNPIGPTIISIPKAGLLANPPDISGRTSFGTLSYSALGDIVQPAITTGNATTPEAAIAVADLGLDFQAHSGLVLSTILNAGGSQASLGSALNLATSAFTVPVNPTQPDGSTNLDDGDARISASVRRVGDIIYATHCIEVNQRAAVRWYRIDAVKSALIDSGTIADPTLDLFYPSIAANEAGTVVIAFNGCSSSSYVSSYAVAGQVANGSLSFGPPHLLQAGTASYQYADSTGTSRWGDYSATSVDPADPNRFWTIQMIAIGTTTWATQITELIMSSDTPPQLTVAAAGQSLVISWPATGSVYQLQTSPSLGAAASWTPIGQNPAVQNNSSSVVLPVSDTQAFFRLVSSSGPAQN
jgi:hypothetical protein